jgi:hypothetical protein
MSSCRKPRSWARLQRCMTTVRLPLLLGSVVQRPGLRSVLTARNGSGSTCCVSANALCNQLSWQCLPGDLDQKSTTDGRHEPDQKKPIQVHGEARGQMRAHPDLRERTRIQHQRRSQGSNSDTDPLHQLHWSHPLSPEPQDTSPSKTESLGVVTEGMGTSSGERLRVWRTAGLFTRL